MAGFYVDANAIFESRDDARRRARARALGSGGVLYARCTRRSRSRTARTSAIRRSARALCVEFAREFAVRADSLSRQHRRRPRRAPYVIDTSGGPARCSLSPLAGAARPASPRRVRTAPRDRPRASRHAPHRQHDDARQQRASRDGGAVVHTGAGLAIVGSVLERNAAGGDGGELAARPSPGRAGRSGLSAAKATAAPRGARRRARLCRGGGGRARRRISRGNVARAGGGGLYARLSATLALHHRVLARGLSSVRAREKAAASARERASCARGRGSRLARKRRVCLSAWARCRCATARRGTATPRTRATCSKPTLHCSTAARCTCGLRRTTRAAGDVFHNKTARAGGGLFWNYDGSGMNATDVADYTNARAVLRGNAYGEGGWEPTSRRSRPRSWRRRTARVDSSERKSSGIKFKGARPGGCV